VASVKFVEPDRFIHIPTKVTHYLPCLKFQWNINQQQSALGVVHIPFFWGGGGGGEHELLYSGFAIGLGDTYGQLRILLAKR